MRVLQKLVVVAVFTVAMTGCTSVPPEELGVSLPTSTIEPSTTTVDPSEGEGTVDGVLGVGGVNGLEVVDVGGSPIGAQFVDGVGTQPTWSRDGAALIGFVPESATTGSTVVLRGDAVSTHPARRAYFFFSWSGDGSLVAALGPGPEGTTLDILGADGIPVSEQSLDTQSFYLAWEPGGDDLVVHRDAELELIRDPLDLETREPLGRPGQDFLAPAWIPGTRSILIVDNGRLVRLDVDTAVGEDLGPVGGQAGIVVSPDGSRALLAHSDGDLQDGDVTVAFDAVADITASTEIIDLRSGERFAISDDLSLWGEWSPDGSRIALLQAADEGAAWMIWDDGDVSELVTFFPTPTFFRNYVFFAWQYVESPRIWSPGSDAISYAATVDGRPQIIVHPLGADDRLRVDDGNVAFFSPGDAPADSAPSPS